MHIDPQESREARAETGLISSVAASSLTPLASSPAPGPRDSSPVPCRGGGTGQQPFPLGDIVGTPLRRSVRPIDPAVLRRIFDDEVPPAPMVSPPPTWKQIGVSALAVLAFVLFVMALDGGLLR